MKDETKSAELGFDADSDGNPIVYAGDCPMRCGMRVYWNGRKDYGPFVCSDCEKAAQVA